ncbi:MAG: DinB family protein [Caldilineales bacterium]
MPTQPQPQLDELMRHIEETWSNLNMLFDDLTAGNRWNQKHGPDWTFADVPYHLAYCNQEILIRSLKAGPDLPEDQQELLASADAVNAWNARKFAERPAGQTAEQSVSQWRATCAEVRRLVSEMTDADLDRLFWMILFAGWSTAREGLEFTRAHDWSEFMQLRIHMGRDDPVPSAGVTRAYLHRMLGGFPLFLNWEAAADREFTAVIAFTDPGVGAFTIHVADGSAQLADGETPGADLVMTERSVTFLKTLTKMLDPVEAIQSGLIQVSDFGSLATFGQLFPIP